MKILLLLVLVTALVASALSFLPWWASFGVAIIAISVIGWLVWKVKAMVKGIAGVAPQEKKYSLKAGENFDGKLFSFSLSTGCEVIQTTVSDDFETLVIKPEVKHAGPAGDSMMSVATIARDEIKQQVSRKLDDIFAKVQELQVGEFQPLPWPGLQGEIRTFAGSRDGKSVQGENAYLGDENFSIAWVIITSPESFNTIAEQYRSFAASISKKSESNLSQASTSNA